LSLSHSRINPTKEVSTTPPTTWIKSSTKETKTHVAIMTAWYADVASELRSAMYAFGDVAGVIPT
jgi:hypothetical protein